MALRNLALASTLIAASVGFVRALEAPTRPGATYNSGIRPEQRRVFFGELHLHTAMSFDAWTFGTKVTPDQAYKFGRGETVIVPAGQIGAEEGVSVRADVPAKRAWPLDFMAVTDHAEFMGVINQLDNPANPLVKTPIGQQILKNPSMAFYMLRTGGDSGAAAKLNVRGAMEDAWHVEMKAANDNYEPGSFTTFVAYEWTANAQGKYNLHRNVIFNSDHAPMPFTSRDSIRPEDLWSYLERTRANGIDAIAIPHNGNVSGGLMYDWNDTNGRPISEQYAQRRALNEPLTEIVQTKGQSDTVPGLSPNDEFANYEIFDHLIAWPGITSNPNGSYIRQAFGRGLVIQSNVGINPYKYGLVSGSDFHNGLETSNQNAFASWAFGLDPNTMMPKGDAAKMALGYIKTPALDMNAAVNHTTPTTERPLLYRPSGVTGVWAEENTRNSIFAALKRKEVFATSGTRIRVRMFGGWDFDAETIENGDWARKAYADGVPMGSDLPRKPVNAAEPRFILQAVKDPDGANLDRIQMIKVWLEGHSYKEKVFDVALSGMRRDDPGTGRAPTVGNTVNLKSATYKNTIGTAILTAVWKDPEFDGAKPAVYFARVLEIPTPRWSTLLAVKNGLPVPKDATATVQERAWTSPIWYTPTKS